MNADGLRVHGNFGSIIRSHRAAFCDLQSLPARFLRIADQCVVKFSGAQGSVGFVATVCKCFSSDSETAESSIEYFVMINTISYSYQD